jgi:ADP-ribose pyrophosphatase YjhB (NUDIX family)
MRQLHFHDSQRFAELNVEKIPSDQFSYHLRQLLKYGLVEKDEQGRYRLSVLGRSRALLLRSDENRYIEQGFVAVRLVIVREHRGHKQYLMQENRLVPFKRAYQTPGDKVFFGEDVADTAIRAAREQCGLECEVRLCGITHYKERYLGRVVQDKFFFVFLATSWDGELREVGKKGSRNLWMSRKELEDSPKTLHGAMDIIEMAESEQLAINERTFDVESY